MLNTLNRTVACLAVLLLALTGCQAEPSLTLVSTYAQADGKVTARQVSQRTRAAATAVLASLSDEQKAKAVRPLADPLREDWHFIPRDRQGLSLGELDLAQKTLVHKLLQTALSDSGYLKATDIIWLEALLYEMENKRPMRDPGKYALIIFGDPADEKAAWGWRFEGHHLSINLTYTPEGIGVTPLFFGTNPAVVPEGPLAGKRVLADGHNLAIELAQSMNLVQKKMMLLDAKPRDVISGPSREGAMSKPAGIDSSRLSARQSQLLLSLIGVHLNTIEDKHNEAFFWQREEIEVNNPQEIFRTFAWAGPIDADEPFYYRIWTPTLVIEYSCQGKNHVHVVMHDLTDPLQADLLKAHFEQHEHGGE